MDHRVHFGTNLGMPFSPPLVDGSATDSDVIDADEGHAVANISAGKGGELQNALDIDAGYVPAGQAGSAKRIPPSNDRAAREE